MYKTLIAMLPSTLTHTPVHTYNRRGVYENVASPDIELRRAQEQTLFYGKWFHPLFHMLHTRITQF